MLSEAICIILLILAAPIVLVVAVMQRSTRYQPPHARARHTRSSQVQRTQPQGSKSEPDGDATRLLGRGARSIRSGRADYRPIAIINSLYLPPAVSAQRMRNWTLVHNRPGSAEVKALLDSGARIDFIYADGDFLMDSSMYHVEATLKPRLDSANFYDKVRLHMILMTAAPYTICDTIEVTAQTVAPEGVWILRPNWGWQGKGTIVTHSPADFTTAYTTIANTDLSTLNTVANDVKLKRDQRVIASRYITDPMLYRGYKFHLRITVIALIDNANVFHLWVKNKGFVIPAGTPYVADSYDNADIHDTHFKRNRSILTVFPCADIPDATPAAVNALLSAVFNAAGPHVKKFPEAWSAYDVYGLDVMFTAAGDAKLIEINRLPSFIGKFTRPKPPDYVHDTSFCGADHDAELFESVLVSAVAHTFGLPESPYLPRDDLVTKLI